MDRADLPADILFVAGRAQKRGVGSRIKAPDQYTSSGKTVSGRGVSDLKIGHSGFMCRALYGGQRYQFVDPDRRDARLNGQSAIRMDICRQPVGTTLAVSKELGHTTLRERHIGRIWFYRDYFGAAPHVLHQHHTSRRSRVLFDASARRGLQFIITGTDMPKMTNTAGSLVTEMTKDSRVVNPQWAKDCVQAQNELRMGTQRVGVFGVTEAEITEVVRVMVQGDIAVIATLCLVSSPFKF